MVATCRSPGPTIDSECQTNFRENDRETLGYLRAAVAKPRPCRCAAMDEFCSKTGAGLVVESLEVDVVVCDGPSAYSVYLDDIDRSSERKIAKRWSNLLQIPFSYQLLRGSFAVGMKGAHYNSLI